MSATTRIQNRVLGALAGADDWMSLRALRDAVGYTVEDEYGFLNIDRSQIDQALTELHATRQIYLIPESNQKALTSADRDAALWLGGEYRHLAATELLP